MGFLMRNSDSHCEQKAWVSLENGLILTVDDTEVQVGDVLVLQNLEPVYTWGKHLLKYRNGKKV